MSDEFEADCIIRFKRTDLAPGSNGSQAANATTATSYLLTPTEIALFSLVYALTTVVAILGNVLIIWILSKTGRLRQSNTNFFIINLALVDLFILIFNLPWTFIYTVNGNVWPWGGIWCKLVWSVGAAALSSNAFTFAAIMVDRYQAIANPLHKYVERRRRVFVALVCIWVLSFLTGLPSLIGYDAHHFGNDEVPRYVCSNLWQPEFEFAHITVLVTVQYVIPLIITLIAYRFIRSKLCNSQAIGEWSQAEAAGIRTKHRVVNMMMAVVVAFTVCVFPNNVFVLVLNWPGKTLLHRPENARAVIRTFLIVYWFAMSNSMVNPFIYAYWNSTFSLGFKYAFRWLPCIRWDPDTDAPRFFEQRRTMSTVTYRGSSVRVTNRTLSIRDDASYNGHMPDLRRVQRTTMLDDPIAEKDEFLGEKDAQLKV